MTDISFLIKTYNEERKIAACIESCICASQDVSSEIIVSDSLSNDRTVEIAMRYPVKIVRLINETDRSCGAAPQLGFQHSRGEFICLLDGDMVLDAAFVAEATRFLRLNPNYAGAGGIIKDVNLDNLEFASRAARAEPLVQARDVDRLEGGGVYRRTAIESVGYLSDRNLHGYEEFELGTRLRSKGWKLRRLPVHAADHYGYTIGAYSLLIRRIKGGYVFAGGEVIRSAIHSGQMTDTVLGIKGLRPTLFLICLLCGMGAVMCMPIASSVKFSLNLTIFLMPFVLMSIRRHSIALGVYAVVVWYVYALGTFRGLMQRRKDPVAKIPSETVQSA